MFLLYCIHQKETTPQFMKTAVDLQIPPFYFWVFIFLVFTADIFSLPKKLPEAVASGSFLQKYKNVPGTKLY